MNNSSERYEQTQEPNQCIHKICGYCEFSANYRCPFVNEFDATKNCNEYEED